VTGFRSLGGGLRSWLAVRCTCTAALNLTAPSLLRLLRRQLGILGDAGGGPRSGVWSEKASIPAKSGDRAEERNPQ
jgi:hypothetical protein